MPRMGDLPLAHLLLVCFFFSLLLPQTRATLLRENHICLDGQKSALLLLQQESIDFSLWEPETDCCSWEGVTCNVTTGYVIGLDLSSMLSGRIHSNSSLFGLHHLRRLNLADNDFMLTPIPSGFDRLPSLTHLNLSDTCFSGQIPWEFSRLTRLVSLDLSTHQYCTPSPDSFDLNSKNSVKDLSSLVELKRPKLDRPNLEALIQNLTYLKKLYLDGVDLSTQGSDWSQVLAQALPNLRALSLSNCRLSGPIHSSLSQLVFLMELQLDDNNLIVEAPKFLANFSHLKTLSLSSCGLYGEFPSSVFQLPNLQILDVSFNSHLAGQLPNFPHNTAFKVMSLYETNFSGEIPDSIGNLRFLMKLQLYYCNFSGSVSPSLTNLTQLTELNLAKNAFTGSIPSALANLSHLAILDLSSNSFIGSVPRFNKDNVPNLATLYLTDNLLDGIIHSSLFTLPSLQSLQLSSNHFRGPLELFHNNSSISSLEFMDLSDNKLNGQLPKSISQLSSLLGLRLSSNDFSGTVTMDMFRNLENHSSLDLSDNLLSFEAGNGSSAFPQLMDLSLRSCHLKEFPNFLRTQENLMTLDLSNNQIQGHVPSWIWKGTVEYVDLSYNGIEGFEPVFVDHSNNDSINNTSRSTLKLFYLILISCNLSAFPEFLKDANELRYLDLSNNNISGYLPNWIWTEHLDYFNLSYNSLNAFERPLLNFSLSPLDTLDLHFNKIQGPIPIPSSSVTFFSISNNSFIGGIPESICKLRSLQIFDASYNNLSGEIPECLGEIGTLLVLNVQGNRFHGMPQHFTNASSLRTLKINGNILEGQMPRSLANCTSLEVLDLGKNKMFDTFPFWLGKLPMLRVLVLHSNKFYGPIKHPQAFNEFPMLQIMDLSSNRFTGNLPTEYFQVFREMMSKKGNKSEPQYIGEDYYTDSVTIMNKGLEMELVRILTIFTALDLSDNRFQGEIPEMIGELTSLVVLNLSQNVLTGQIPSLIGNMAELESLDLSRNKLSGQIPWQLTGLTFLEFLNLSQNHLEGPIPRGHQLDTFSNTSYNENPGLCGFPLSKKCRDASDDIPPPVEKSKYSTNDLKFDWKSVLMGYGCGMVIGIVIGHVIFKEAWLIRTFRMAPSGRQRNFKRGRLRR